LPHDAILVGEEAATWSDQVLHNVECDADEACSEFKRRQKMLQKAKEQEEKKVRRLVANQGRPSLVRHHLLPPCPA
jgi:hypothetical protein